MTKEDLKMENREENMNYEEYNQRVYEEFNNSIKTTQEDLKKKILNSMINWYQRVWSEKVKELCQSNDSSELIAISNEIKKIGEKNDIEKLKMTYQDKNYEQFLELSKEIYNETKKAIDSHHIMITEEKYQNYVNQINDYETKISPIFQEEYKKNKSECFLDLDYLKSEGKKEIYSFRLYRYLTYSK